MKHYFSPPLAAGLVALGLLALAPKAVLAAESYDNCNGVVASLPATITTQGVWCLKKNLVHSASSGAAITVSANNVTLDCNNFNMDASAGAAGSNGISGSVMNTTVRNCGIRGFRSGIHLQGSGHLVENNYLDRNRVEGIRVTGDNHRVVGNRVFNMLGGAGEFDQTIGIVAHGDVMNNVVSGLVSGGANWVYGINATGVGAEISGNTVRGFMLASNMSARAIFPRSQGMKIRNNHVISAHSNSQQTGTVSGFGLDNATGQFCGDNTIVGFVTNIRGACKAFGGPGNTGG